MVSTVSKLGNFAQWSVGITILSLIPLSIAFSGEQSLPDMLLGAGVFPKQQKASEYPVRLRRWDWLLLLIASVLYSMPFAVQPFAAEFASVDRRLLEASWSLGVSRLDTFRRVVIPLSVRGLVTGIVLSFAHTLGEFGVVLMVGGNLPGVTRTVSISIYDAVQSLDYAAASRTSLLLLIVSFVILASIYSLQRSVWLKPRH